MASEMENLVAGYFHAVRKAAKDRRRPHPGQDRLLQAMIDRSRAAQRRSARLDAIELDAERFAFERSLD